MRFDELFVIAENGAGANSLRAAFAQPHAGSILRALLVLALGAVGVYLMIPRGQPPGRRFARLLGGALATAALVLLVTIPVSAVGVDVQPLEPAGASGAAPVSSVDLARRATFLWPLSDQARPTCSTFHILAMISLASAVMMITSRNPVYSALWFAMVLLANSGLYMMQRADFLSAATIIIYAGAIVVTFLFVIMLAQPTGTARYDRISREPLLSTATGLVLAAVLVGTLHFTARYERAGRSLEGTFRPRPETVAAAAAGSERFSRVGQGDVSALGKTLFVDHVASVEVIGLLLLAAVVGAVLIAGHPIEDQPPGPSPFRGEKP